MFLVRRPSDEKIRALLASSADLPLNYPEVGATAGTPPGGYTVDHHRCAIGQGEAAFGRAAGALRGWRMYPAEWIRICWTDTPIEPGALVGTLVRVLGVWTLNACRILRVIEETEGSVQRFGFVWGTVRGHAEAGEERFLVEWDRDSSVVEYEILAFSRAEHPFAKLGHPLLRRLQGRFFADSRRLMQEAAGGAG
jgi:uncharacterized protein (UPF0548 family)